MSENQGIETPETAQQNNQSAELSILTWEAPPEEAAERERRRNEVVRGLSAFFYTLKRFNDEGRRHLTDGEKSRVNELSRQVQAFIEDMPSALAKDAFLAASIDQNSEIGQEIMEYGLSMLVHV